MSEQIKARAATARAATAQAGTAQATALHTAGDRFNYELDLSVRLARLTRRHR